ncbi:hypothetical protein F5Y08DRAFT_307473 [Xylaria arbuscula]|nr:hypothetical protein F5Y08DRAFT_307473 [Xylaria arbuscula]
MLQLIDKALESSNMGGDSPRDCVFEVYRPDFEHIKPPHDMDMSAHIFASSCNDFEWEDDSDDDEADVPSGRISPCTFLEWSKDCVRWNADDREIKQDTRSYRRMRPPTPINTEPPRRHAPPRCHEHVPCNRVEKQWDINTGEELTPTYHVPNSPSIIYTPPGIEFAGFRTPNFHMQYRRMAPLAERDLRTRVYNGPNVAPPESSDAERDRFTASEVDAAAAVIPEAHNIRGAEVSSILREQYAAIQQAEEAERALYRHAELQREHIARLQFDQRHLNEFLPALHMRREMRDREQERRRAERIRGYVVDHALDTQTRLDMAWFRLTSTQARVQENMRNIAGLERELRDLCESTGVRDPEHAYAVLMGAASEGSSRGSLYGAGVNEGGLGAGGHSRPGAQPFGPWSPSSLGRADEEFDRLAANMRMGGARGDPRGWQRRWDDEASGDSGVAGIQNRFGPRFNDVRIRAEI